MKTTIEITKDPHGRASSYILTFVTRINSAIEMLHLTNKLVIEQETTSAYSVFQERLEEFGEKNGVFVILYVEHFEGISDVIFELKVQITQREPAAKVEINSPKILGTMFEEVKKYFKWDTYMGLEFINKYDREDYEYLFKSTY